MENLNFTENELSYITESLLFSLGCDVCANWDRDDIEKLFEIAQKIKNNNSNINLNNIFVHNPLLENGNTYFDEITPKIILNFPEILKEDIV
jgi:hypothetical protein